MNKLMLEEDQVLLVVSRGTEERSGLWVWSLQDCVWAGRQIGKAPHLSALAGHPGLPIVYGTASAGEGGRLHAWRIDRSGETQIGEISSQGIEPCHLAIDPSGQLLVATNYESGTLALQRLDEHGAFIGPLALLKLTGSGPDADRQDGAHPHQALFIEDKLVVIDLGADLVREFSLHFDREGADTVAEVRATAMPAGSGPRHAVVLPDGRLAVTGELSETLLVGHLGAPRDQWATIPSTGLKEPGKTRWARNYPGDIRLSLDKSKVYLANRSHDSVATFDISGPVPKLVSEGESGGLWPQHMIPFANHVVVANWDSSSVTALPLHDGIPQVAEPLFECESAAWLHLHRLVSTGPN